MKEAAVREMGITEPDQIVNVMTSYNLQLLEGAQILTLCSHVLSQISYI